MKSVKKLAGQLCLAVVLLWGFSKNVSAQVVIDSNTFPDPGFREYVQSAYDINADGSLSDEEIASAIEMDVYFCADPEQMVSLIERGDSGYSESVARCVVAEFPCKEINKHPLSDEAPYGNGINYTDHVNHHQSSYASYITGKYGWKAVIAKPMTSCQGIEYLTELHRVSVGGDLPENMIVSGLPKLQHLKLAGADTTVKALTVQGCPRLKTFYYQESDHLTQIDLTDVADKLQIIRKCHEISAASGGGIGGVAVLAENTTAGERTETTVPVERMIIGDAPNLRVVNIEPSYEINYKTLKNVTDLKMTLVNPEAVVDLSACKKLKYLGVYDSSIRKLILPNSSGMSLFMSSLADKQAQVKEMDIRKIKKANQKVADGIFLNLLEEYKYKAGSPAKQLVVTRRMYKKYKKTIKKFTKHNFIKVVVK